MQVSINVLRRFLGVLLSIAPIRVAQGGRAYLLLVELFPPYHGRRLPVVQSVVEVRGVVLLVVPRPWIGALSRLKVLHPAVVLFAFRAPSRPGLSFPLVSFVLRRQERVKRVRGRNVHLYGRISVDHCRATSEWVFLSRLR